MQVRRPTRNMSGEPEALRLDGPPADFPRRGFSAADIAAHGRRFPSGPPFDWTIEHPIPGTTYDPTQERPDEWPGTRAINEATGVGLDALGRLLGVTRALGVTDEVFRYLLCDWYHHHQRRTPPTPEDGPFTPPMIRPEAMNQPGVLRMGGYAMGEAVEGVGRLVTQWAEVRFTSAGLDPAGVGMNPFVWRYPQELNWVLSCCWRQFRDQGPGFVRGTGAEAHERTTDHVELRFSPGTHHLLLTVTGIALPGSRASTHFFHDPGPAQTPEPEGNHTTVDPGRDPRATRRHIRRRQLFGDQR